MGVVRATELLEGAPDEPVVDPAGGAIEDAGVHMRATKTLPPRSPQVARSKKPSTSMVG